MDLLELKRIHEMIDPTRKHSLNIDLIILASKMKANIN